MLTQARLKELASYDPETGIFRWIKIVGKKGYIGKVIGSKRPDGYLEAKIDGNRLFLHRAAFLYMTGSIPKMVDHANADREDNRWDNLREATQQQNSANMIKKKNNTSGFKGVHFSKKNKNWVANIHIGYKTKYLGSFSSKEEAHSAYMAAAIAVHGEFARAA